MPLARYFLYVGGVLLVLLFVADAWMPKSPARAQAEASRPAILLYSDRNWPERVVYNTSALMISPVPSASRGPYIPAPERFAAEPVKVREAFAALRPSDAKNIRSAHSAQLPARRIHTRQVVRKIPRTMLAMAPRQFGNHFVRMW